MASAVEYEIEKSESKKSVKVNKCDKKCAHQSDRICYNEEDNKEVIRKIPEGATSGESTESVEDVDSLHSGESLFKTFAFDTQENDPDLEKCMSFWKNVLEKNIKPLKCTLLRNKKEEVKEEKAKTNEKDPCKEEETRKMWMEIYRDLQRRKLDKLKLVKGKTCDPCEEYIDEEQLKKQDVEDIKKLNEWKADKKKAASGSGKKHTKLN